MPANASKQLESAIKKIKIVLYEVTINKSLIVQNPFKIREQGECKEVAVKTLDALLTFC